MKFLPLLFLFAASSAYALEPAAQDLFDGRTLHGWQSDGTSWRSEGGIIVGEVPAGQVLRNTAALTRQGTVHDFDFTAEYRITGGPGANAAIGYRGGYQVMLDEGALWLGRIYEDEGRGLLAERGTRAAIAPDGRRWKDELADISGLAKTSAKPHEWNRLHVRSTASHTEVWINNVLFSVLDDHEVGKARFGGALTLQLHSGPGPVKVEFRALKLADLGETEAPAYKEVRTAAAASSGAGDAIQAAGDDGKPLNLGFETGTLAGWKAEGDAWEGQPVKGDTVAARRHGNSHHVGEYWIGGYEKNGDKGTGRLTSASFTVTQPWASFLVGGGQNALQTRVEIVAAADGKVIRAASGLDHEDMRREVVDLHDWTGRKIFIRLVDEGKGGWGHVNFDDFVFHAQKPAFAAPAVSVNPGDRAARQKESPVLWHLQPNPAKPIKVANEEAQKVVAGMMLTHGFQAELIAAEPEVRQPVAFAMDDRGRLWVAEAYSYPNRQPEGKGRDRITIFEDVDGDGSFKKRKVFTEGLNLVSGLEVGFGGVWVGAAPQLLFIPDRNHDDVPDGPPEVLLDGWGYQDTHETINSFCWGPDGWLYGNQGVFTKSLIGKPGTPDDQRVPLHSGVWRYHPVRHEFEIFAHGGSNQWGLDFNEAGHLFITHCRSFWGGGGTTQVIRNGHFWNQANSGYALFISNSAPAFAPDVKNFLPASARYDSGEGGAGKPGTTAIYGGHSHVGTMIYLGDNWPEIYRDHLFTHNLHGHQMNQQENLREGSGYETMHAGYDLMFTPDPKYIAVDLQTGPDGAVYVIDWCDLQHCHNPAEEKWDRSNGRIYRISWAKTYHPVKVNLGAMSDLELTNLQTHHNDWYTRTARQLLQERAAAGKLAPEAVAALVSLAADSPNYAHVLRALWTLHVTGHLNTAILEKALHHSDDRVRAWAVQLGTDHAVMLPAETLATYAAHDPSPTVRLALASALPVLPADACWKVGTALAMHGEDATDRFLPKMIWFGLGPVVAQDFARGLNLADHTPLPTLADSIRWYAAASATGREALVEGMAKAPDVAAKRELGLLVFGLKSEARAPLPKAWPQVQGRFAGDAEATEAGVLFGDQKVIAQMRSTLADDRALAAARHTAFDLLKRIGDAESTPLFARLLDVQEFRSAVIPLLSRSSDPATAAALMQRFNAFSDADRNAALNSLTSRAALAMPLLQAVKAGRFDRKHLSAFQVRQMRNLHDKELDQVLDQTWGKVNESSAAMKETIARLQKAYQEAPLWAFDGNAGKQVFQQVCAVCHSMNGVGGKLGPDLGGSWRNGAAYFLENIVDPNAVVGDQFQLTIITRKDGMVLSGIADEESDSAVTIRTMTGPVIVPKAEIKDRQKLAQSLMPPGLLEAMPERKVIELLKYLTSKSS